MAEEQKEPEVAREEVKPKPEPEKAKEVISNRYWTPKEVGERFGYSPAWITEWCRKKMIWATRPSGGRWRIPNSEVERIAREGTPVTPRPERKLPEPTRIVVEAEKEGKVAPHKKEEVKEEEEKKGRGEYWPLPFSLKGKT